MDTEQICKDEGISFIPLIFETAGGGWGPAASAVLNEIAKHKSTMTGETVSVTASRMLQTLGIILHKENARAIIRRSQCIDTNNEFSELLSAFVAFGANEDPP